jgi:hypothetical protein
MRPKRPDPPAKAPAGRTLPTILAEFRCDAPFTRATLEQLERSCEWCFKTHRVQLVGALLARNNRVVLMFRAPDQESVRIVSRRLQIALERIWSWPSR